MLSYSDFKRTVSMFKFDGGYTLDNNDTYVFYLYSQGYTLTYSSSGIVQEWDGRISFEDSLLDTLKGLLYHIVMTTDDHGWDVTFTPNSELD